MAKWGGGGGEGGGGESSSSSQAPQPAAKTEEIVSHHLKNSLDVKVGGDIVQCEAACVLCNLCTLQLVYSAACVLCSLCTLQLVYSAAPSYSFNSCAEQSHKDKESGQLSVDVET